MSKQIQIPAIDAIGKRFGRLKVISIFYKENGNGQAWAKCICSCKDKTICELKLTSVRSGRTRSCGCYAKEVFSANGKKCKTQFKEIHGESRSIQGHIWYGMIQRCYYENCKQYKDYGGRGIEVHKPWRSKSRGLIRFIRWLLSDEGIGRRPNSKYSLDRIDNDGNYEPGNLKWSTKKEQNNNKRSKYNKKDAQTIFLILKDIKHIRKLTANESKIYYKLKRDILSKKEL